MGEHKHNPTAIAAKAGALPPKPRPVGKAESMRRCRRLVHDYLYKNTAENDCGIHGCAILRKTIAWLEQTLTTEDTGDD